MTNWNPETIEHIETQPDSDFGVRACGCEPRRARWWLCQYHQGYDEGIDLMRERLDTMIARGGDRARMGCPECLPADNPPDMRCINCGAGYRTTTEAE